MYYILIAVLLLSSDFFTDAGNHPKIGRKTFISAVFSNNNVTYQSGLCRWLRGLKYQNRLCRRRKGFAEVLMEARELAVINCREQFRYERWNCSIKRNIFKQLYRETALLQSLASSALTYTISRACSDGKLLNCGCAAPSKIKLQNSSHQWGGCGDNVRTAAKITRQFLQMRKLSADWPDKVIEYDAEVGISMVGRTQTTFCACHGVSASCVMKTCWRRVRPYHEIAEKLKKAYHTAVQVDSENKPTSITSVIPERKPSTLLYFTPSPNYCLTTVGRRCKDECENVCCSRGFYEIVEVVKEKCKCKWLQQFPQLDCDMCEKENIVNICR